MALAFDYHLHRPPYQTLTDYHRPNRQLVDVRSPSEFSNGTILGAVNIPLLDDLERGLIGTQYKHQGRNVALESGYLIAERKLGFFQQSYARFDKKKPLFMFCARGGFRSRSLCKLLREWGYDALQLKGGYKAYRAWCRQFLERLDFTGGLFVIHGRTGVGKTHLLKFLANSLDLEAAAKHRGSLLGGIGMIPSTQKEFDSLLIKQLQQIDLGKPVFIEGESAKIGNVFIPKVLWDAMAQACKILAVADMDVRVARIYNEYVVAGNLSFADVKAQLDKLQPVCSSKMIQDLKDNWRKGLTALAIKQLCQKYYDPKYQHGQKKLEFQLTVNCHNLKQTAQQVAAFAAQWSQSNKRPSKAKAQT